VARLTVEGDELVVGLSALEKLASLRGDLRLPLRTVREVAVEPSPWPALRGMRAPGTGIPGVIAYGVRRWTGGPPDFAAVHGKRPALRIELDPPAEFGRVLVTVPDPQAAVAAVRRAG
jgi:hypothetical protein